MNDAPAPAPMAEGSVSLRLYPHNDLDASAIVETLLDQGRRASVAGLDGVMTAEHHGGFGGYLPNSLQAAGWLLEVMPRGWAAACPLLLPLRPAAMVAEETAWLAARFPGRVGLGVAAGSLVDDFEIMDTDKVDLSRRFAEGLAMVTGMLSGRDPGRLAGDRAIARCAEHPVPVLSAAMRPAAVRRAAACGAGLIFESLSTTDRVRELADLYREAGGAAPTVMIRRVWVGEPPATEVERQRDLYRTYALQSAQAHWGGQEMVTGPDPASVAEGLLAVKAAAGVGALNLRLHAPGIPPEAIAEQIDALGEVARLVRAG
jgi:alkanesulfonate monooxygenase SsuD/methylene tetrahydromethanopterin reductase-like flavin-dependent oxidoreductase (luciferase family)